VKLRWYCWVLLGGAGIYGVAKVLEESADPSDDEGPIQSFITTVSTLVDLIQSQVTGDRRLTSAKKNAAGVVLDTVDDLVSAAETVVGRSIDRDAYSLARALRSEGGNESETSKRYRAAVILNQARSRGLSVTSLALLHTNAARNGHYGKQIGAAFATSEDPFESDLAIAESADVDNDPTGGAIQFSDKGGFSGIQEGTSTWSEHVAQRISEGKSGGTLPDARRGLVFWWRGFIPKFATPI